MTQGSTLPVVALGDDGHGRPTRFSVPGLTRSVPIVSSGRRIGEVARDGTVTSTGAAAAGRWHDYVTHSKALDQAALARRRLLATVVDGQVVAVVVPNQKLKGTTNAI